MKLSQVPGASRDDRWLNTPRVKPATIAGKPLTIIHALVVIVPTFGERVKVIVKSQQTGNVVALFLGRNQQRDALVAHFSESDEAIGPVILQAVQGKSTNPAWVFKDA